MVDEGGDRPHGAELFFELFNAAHSASGCADAFDAMPGTFGGWIRTCRGQREHVAGGSLKSRATSAVDLFGISPETIPTPDAGASCRRVFRELEEQCREQHRQADTEEPTPRRSPVTRGRVVRRSGIARLAACDGTTPAPVDRRASERRRRSRNTPTGPRRVRRWR